MQTSRSWASPHGYAHTCCVTAGASDRAASWPGGAETGAGAEPLRLWQVCEAAGAASDAPTQPLQQE